MKTSTVNTLIICGTVLILVPWLAGTFAESNGLNQRLLTGEFKFVTTALGWVIMGIGIVKGWRGNRTE